METLASIRLIEKITDGIRPGNVLFTVDKVRIDGFSALVGALGIHVSRHIVPVTIPSAGLR